MRIILLTIMLFFSLLTAPRTYAKEGSEENNVTEKSNTNDIPIYSGVGLIAVGGAGSIVIAHNSKKKKDEPSDEIKSSERKDIE